jgi:hypothetical protein
LRIVRAHVVLDRRDANEGFGRQRAAAAEVADERIGKTCLRGERLLLGVALPCVAVFAETGCYAQAQAVGEHVAIGRDGRARVREPDVVGDVGSGPYFAPAVSFGRIGGGRKREKRCHRRGEA